LRSSISESRYLRRGAVADQAVERTPRNNLQIHLLVNLPYASTPGIRAYSQDYTFDLFRFDNSSWAIHFRSPPVLAGVLSVGLSVSQSLLGYYVPYKAYDEESKNFTTRTEGFKSDIQGPEQLLTTREALAASQNMNVTTTAVASLPNCHERLWSLQDRADKCLRKMFTEESRMENWLGMKRLQ
jgi:hypothetical protein